MSLVRRTFVPTFQRLLQFIFERSSIHYWLHHVIALRDLIKLNYFGPETFRVIYWLNGQRSLSLTNVGGGESSQHLVFNSKEKSFWVCILRHCFSHTCTSIFCWKGLVDVLTFEPLSQLQGKFLWYDNAHFYEDVHGNTVLCKRTTTLSRRPLWRPLKVNQNKDTKEPWWCK